jgi:hypothetical protein|nr:MAG TPA: hypothetical protein [Inoviridae sp.]
MFDLFKFFTIDQLLEWFKVHDYPASVYEDIISDEGLADFLYFFRDGNVWATDGPNEWLFIEFV